MFRMRVALVLGSVDPIWFRIVFSTTTQIAQKIRPNTRYIKTEATRRREREPSESGASLGLPAPDANTIPQTRGPWKDASVDTSSPTHPETGAQIRSAARNGHHRRRIGRPAR